MNVLPTPGVLASRISPPSSRAISRLIARPRPVPPYLRLVLPSACWNASKMICCLSGGMPMPVSVTENASTLSLELSDLVVRIPAVVGRLHACKRTWPWCVNLKALESRFLMTCCSRLASVMIDRGSSGSSSIDEVDALGLGHVAERALDVVVQVVEPQLADVDHDRARLDLRQVENVVDQHQQVVAGRVDRLGELGLLRREVAVGVLRQLIGEDEQAVERRAQLVRHVGQELATCTSR